MTIHKPSPIRRNVSPLDLQIQISKDLHHLQQTPPLISTVNLQNFRATNHILINLIPLKSNTYLYERRLVINCIVNSYPTQEKDSRIKTLQIEFWSNQKQRTHSPACIIANCLCYLGGLILEASFWNSSSTLTDEDQWYISRKKIKLFFSGVRIHKWKDEKGPLFLLSCLREWNLAERRNKRVSQGVGWEMGQWACEL